MNGLAPSYLSDVLQPYKQRRVLRSNSKYLLAVPPSKTITLEVLISNGKSFHSFGAQTAKKESENVSF